MRKTKLIILPTKCLNQMGFLLLFLSCPVIGDWGRIKPDSEMTQWSILIDREGSCGLVRNPPDAKNELMLDGRTEYEAFNMALRNSTILTANNVEINHLSIPEIALSEPEVQRSFRSYKTQPDSERRMSHTKYESRDGLLIRYGLGRQVKIEKREDRRAVSLDRRNAYGNMRRGDRVTEYRTYQLREARVERREYRRQSASLDRRIDRRQLPSELNIGEKSGRFQRNNRLSSNRRDDIVRFRRNERVRIRQETPKLVRREQYDQSRRTTEEQRLIRRMENAEISRRVERNIRDTREITDRENIPRRMNSERRIQVRQNHRRIAAEDKNSDRKSSERGYIFRNNVEERRIGERYMVAERATSEQRRVRSQSSDSKMARSAERKLQSQRARSESDIRAIRHDPAKRNNRDTSVSLRREDSRRNVRTMSQAERADAMDRRSERRDEISAARKKNDFDFARRQAFRIGVQRVEKSRERRDLSVLAERAKDRRDISPIMQKYFSLDSLVVENEKSDGSSRWEFFENLKSWFGQKTAEEDWITNNVDFKKTCLIGAAVYLLTTRQAKTN